ncbi:chaperone [Catellatospora sp. IY07-71]|uniref:AAA family ATPase n=1 Tax=Catellatospora sp. IY07-71 TaxID=2728827 RepID=UPI001BB33574|nr:AAA family ATPase [Catellatospora sp. IY07-71]BCJ74592.1 chaperone [Catellatospora sp. IY07-71]
MTAAGPPAAAWLLRAYQELQRGRSLVVHGNVDDLVRWSETYQPFPAAVMDFLSVSGFPVVVRYGLADGLTYYDDASRLFTAPFLQVTEQGAAGPAAAHPVAVPAAGGGGPAGPSAARAARLQEASDALRAQIAAGQTAEPRNLADVLSVLHRLMTQPDRACAVLIDSAELLLGDRAAGSSDHLRHVAFLRRMLAEAAEAPGEHKRLRNTMVFVSADRAALPAWLHTDSPYVASVLAERPDVAERAALVEGRLRHYYEGEQLTPSQLRAATSAMASLTDGMTVRDICSVEVTSHLARIPPTSARRLVARHRFGLRDDPWERLEILKIKNAEALLGQRVIGQPDAVAAVHDVLVNSRVGVDFAASDEQFAAKPKGVLFFVGPTGVGKTELAKAIAELVFDDESALIRFDMSEYDQPHSSERLTGSPPGYVGHEQGGALTNWVQERPFSVLLFDEVEKAHPKVLDKFLQIMEDGRLTDGRGQTVFFSHTIVIFTSNIGASELRNHGVTQNTPYATIRDLFRKAVQEHFLAIRRPELLGRIGGGVVVFDILREPVIRDIVSKFLGLLAASARTRGHEVVFDRPAIDRAVIDEITANGSAYGAREIRTPLLEQWVRAPLNRWILETSPAPGTRILVHRRPDGAVPFAVSAVPEMRGPDD